MTRSSLLRLGFGKRSIEHRLATGRLHRMGRGVYAVGWPEMTQRRRWMAALLQCGDGAVLSHASAAALWGIAPVPLGDVDVTAGRRIHLSGIRARCRRLAPDESTARAGIPVTTIVCTMIDIATELSEARLDRAINEADRLDLIDPESLRSAVDAFSGRRGVRRLRSVLDRHTFRLSDSELEHRFRKIAERAGLPSPLTKQRLNGFEVDFYWPELDLVVETDGLRYHRTPGSQSRDRRRDQAHTAAGLTQLRFTHRQVVGEAPYVRAILLRALRNR